MILEPVVGNMGLVPPRPEFLTELRRLTEQHGALLIYDEVMTGFRLAYGGAQQLYQQTPDLTVLGKIVGGGLPVGAYGGRADVMKQVMPAGPGLPGGHAVGQPAGDGRRHRHAAGAARPSALRQARAARPRRWPTGLTAAAADAGVPHQVQRVGSMWTLFFTAEPVTDYDTAKKSDTARFGRFFWAMMDRGVYLPCSQFEAAFNSVLHTEKHIEQTLAAAKEALAAIKK